MYVYVLFDRTYARLQIKSRRAVRRRRRRWLEHSQYVLIACLMYLCDKFQKSVDRSWRNVYAVLTSDSLSAYKDKKIKTIQDSQASQVRNAVVVTSRTLGTIYFTSLNFSSLC